MSINDLLLPSDPFQGSAEPVEGVITKAPATSTDLAEVAIPTFDDEQALSGLRWMPRGSARPAVGDACLVQPLRSGAKWITAWWPAS